MQTPAALLDAVIKVLTQQKGEVLISTWFDGAEAVALKNGQLVVHVKSELTRETLENRFTQNVSDILFELAGERILPVYISGRDSLFKWKTKEEDPVYAAYTFERFIVGNSNKFAHAAALAVAREPAQLYNPLFIYGQSGLGKTHLLYAIGGHIRKNRPSFRICYIKGDEFTNQLVESIGRGTVADFRNQYRKADLLLVDDIQFISGKDRTQEEFFHTFNTLHEAGKQIVLTSDRPPREIYTLEERLRTRFEWGLLADIQPPDLETRMALAEEKAKLLNIRLTPDIIEYIASAITNNVRQLEGAVKKIGALHALMNEPISLELAREAVEDVLDPKGQTPTPETILNEVAAFYSMSPDKIKGNTKTKDIVLPRQVAIFLIRDITGMSFPDIGKFIGRDHTTAIYAINKLTERMKSDLSLQNAISDLRQNITSK